MTGDDIGDGRPVGWRCREHVDVRQFHPVDSGTAPAGDEYRSALVVQRPDSEAAVSQHQQSYVLVDGEWAVELPVDHLMPCVFVLVLDRWLVGRPHPGHHESSEFGHE